MEIPYSEILKIVFAFIAGTALGFEREYHDKPAGMRTIILITVGAALFSLLGISMHFQSPDRIASNVVTGVGFVGAGVIFKEGINVHGLTSAATIWVSAAIGMAIGFGDYWLAATTLLLTLFALTLLTSFEKFLELGRSIKHFRFTFNRFEYSIDELENELHSLKLPFKRLTIARSSDDLSIEYKFKLTEKENNKFFDFILQSQKLKNFHEKI